MTNNPHIPTDPEARAWTWLRQCAQLRLMFEACAVHDPDRADYWNRIAGIVGGFQRSMMKAIEDGTPYDVIERHARWIVTSTDVQLPPDFDPSRFVIPEFRLAEDAQ